MGPPNVVNVSNQADIEGSIPAEMLIWAKDEIYNLISKHSVGPTTYKDHAEAFIAAVNWKEPFIISLVCFHLFLWIVSITKRKNSDFQIFLFLFCSLCVYIAEYLNKTLSQGLWQVLCTQNYFDPRGVFAMMMYSGPLLVLLTFILGNIVYQSMQMLVILKRAQLKEKYKNQQKNSTVEQTETLVGKKYK